MARNAFKTMLSMGLAFCLGGAAARSGAQGRVFTWGYNLDFQVVNGILKSNVPVQVPGIDHVVSVSLTYSHMVAVKSDGTVWAWGNGPLGNGYGTYSSVPVQVLLLTDVVAVATGDVHSLALKSDGTVWSWGANTNGQLGYDITTETYVPIQIPNLDHVVAIAARGAWSMALKSDGSVWAWGDNKSGQLGTSPSSVSQSSSPLNVRTESGITAIAAGYEHGIALRFDGTIWTWGDNSYLQLGYASYETANPDPHLVVGLPAASSIAAGWYYSLSMDTTGFVEGWGQASQGQLGNGNVPLVSGLTTVRGLYHPSAIAAGYTHSLAINFYGAWAWGRNDNGELGTGDNNPSDVPVPVQGLPYVTSVAADEYCSAAVEAIGTLPDKMTVSPASGQKGTTSTLAATFQDGSGYPMVGVNVQFAVAGVNVGTPVTTDANGQAKYAYLIDESVDIGRHSYTATFNGNAYYASAVGTSKLTVNRGPVTMQGFNASGSAGKTVTLSSTLTNAAGMPLAGLKVNFTVGLKAVGSATTDATGVARRTYKVPSAMAKGTYPIVATFPGNADHTAGTATTTLTVN